MASKVELCNSALIELGMDPITSMDEGTDSAIKCSAVYDSIAELTMLNGNWTSLIYRATLTQLVETPIFGFNYMYQLPSNPRCLRVLNIQCKDVPYKVERDKLLTNLTTCKIRYLGFVDDASLYDAHLTQAIRIGLKSVLVNPLSGNQQLTMFYKQEYATIMAEAQNRNDLQGSSEDIYSDEVIDSRR